MLQIVLLSIQIICLFVTIYYAIMIVVYEQQMQTVKLAANRDQLDEYKKISKHKHFLYVLTFRNFRKLYPLIYGEIK